MKAFPISSRSISSVPIRLAVGKRRDSSAGFSWGLGISACLAGAEEGVGLVSPPHEMSSTAAAEKTAVNTDLIRMFRSIASEIVRRLSHFNSPARQLLPIILVRPSESRNNRQDEPGGSLYETHRDGNSYAGGCDVRSVRRSGNDLAAQGKPTGPHRQRSSVRPVDGRRNQVARKQGSESESRDSRRSGG